MCVAGRANNFDTTRELDMKLVGHVAGHPWVTSQTRFSLIYLFILFFYLKPKAVKLENLISLSIRMPLEVQSSAFSFSPSLRLQPTAPHHSLSRLPLSDSLSLNLSLARCSVSVTLSPARRPPLSLS